MNKSDAIEAAEALYDGEYGHMSLIAEKLSMQTTLTRRKAKKILRSAIVEYLADLMLDYEEVEL